MSTCNNTLIEFISQDSGLVIVHVNVRSMRANFDSLLVELESIEHLPKIIILSEIWISDSELDFYQIPNYKNYSKTNEEYRAGGVTVYIHMSLSESVVLLTANFVTADALLLNFIYNNRVIHLLALYRLQKYTVETFLQELNITLSKPVVTQSKNMFIVGDVNINILLEENRLVDEYNILLAKHGFESLITVPTRVTETTSTCIDHIFVRMASRDAVSLHSAVIECDVSDHCMTAVWVCETDGAHSADNNRCLKVTRQPTRINYNTLDKLLDNADWSDVFAQQDVSSCVNVFIDRLLNILENSKEELNTNKYTVKKLKPWITISVCNKIKKRNSLIKKLKNEPTNECLKKQIKEFRNKLNSEIRTLKNKYYNKLFDDKKNNIKETWKLLNEVTGQKKTDKTLIKLEINNTIIDDSFTVANKFNEYFLTVADGYTSKNKIDDVFHSLTYKNQFSSKSECNSMFLEPILEYEIVSAIKSLKNGSAAGLDEISTTVIKQIYLKIIHVLLHVVNFSFRTGVFPERLKHALVIPIHKKDDKYKSCNYRPISLLSVFSKIIEKIMKKKLMIYLSRIGFLSKNQFGFQQGLSTETALINFMDKVSNGINNGSYVSGLFLDLTKAFDTVNHCILLKKLYRCGIRGVVFNWFESYLTGRKQCVRVGSAISDFGEIKCGVPQGSVLGPILFLIYVNDLCNGNLFGKLTSFADDTALCYIGMNRYEIEFQINSDLKALRWWFTENDMVLSTEKTKYLNFSLRSNANVRKLIVYKCVNCISSQNQCVNCSEIKCTESIKYLGLVLDSELNWKKHLAFLKSKLVRVLRLFYFLRNLCSRQLMRSIYFALVHSHLDYGISCWGGTYKTNLKPISSCQKSFIRIITNKHKLSTTYPLYCELSILPLRYIFVYKVLKIFYIRSRTVESSDYRDKLRNKDLLIVPRPTSTYFTKTLAFLGPRMFNKIPANIRNIQSSGVFNSKVRKWLFTIDDIEDLFFKIQI